METETFKDMLEKRRSIEVALAHWMLRWEEKYRAEIGDGDPFLILAPIEKIARGLLPALRSSDTDGISRIATPSEVAARPPGDLPPTDVPTLRAS